MDPWREIAAQLKTQIETVTGAGIVVVGHPHVLEWHEFMDLFTDTSGDGGYAECVRGFQIIEPQGDQFRSDGQTLGAGVQIEDKLGFQIRGFREQGEDPDTTQDEYRDLCWEVKRALDKLHDFSITDASVHHSRSYPASTSRVMPMTFGGLDCWGSTITKTVTLMRTETME